MYILTKLWLIGFFLFVILTLGFNNWDTVDTFDSLDALLLMVTGFAMLYQVFQLRGSLDHQKLFK
ncbi:MAG: hypothetical protein DWQ19_10160 [Crenarchaeota archaeon]|nr:MAG: hypothetical protein DWQ19_10160 [Thermoproteota archaeon]